MKWRVLVFLISFSIFTKLAYADDAVNWLLFEGDASGCRMQSVKKTMDDGQGETKVWLEFDSKQMIIKTQSEIDSAYNDLSIKVDDKSEIKSTQIVDKNNLVFQSDIKTITEEFIKGKIVKVNLRFWPTWPTTGLKTTEFSLKGFTKVYRSLKPCP